ncbi:hypothetical protein CcaCcLH18_11559 [Colletotrichum camelliae]|nr:hypothetical protein CcaCcLH18_11559 [Colletotrichum camelliae]
MDDQPSVLAYAETLEMLKVLRKMFEPVPPMFTLPPPLTSSSSLPSLSATPVPPTPVPPKRESASPSKSAPPLEMAPPFGKCPLITPRPRNSIFLFLDEPKHGARHSPDDYAAGQMMSTLNEDNRPYFYIKDQTITDIHVLFMNNLGFRIIGLKVWTDKSHCVPRADPRCNAEIRGPDMFATRDLKKGDEIFLATPNYVCRCLMCLEEARNMERELEEEEKLKAEEEQLKAKEERLKAEEEKRKAELVYKCYSTPSDSEQASPVHPVHIIWTTPITPKNFNDGYDKGYDTGYDGSSELSDEPRLSTIPEESGGDRDGDGDTNMHSGEHDTDESRLSTIPEESGGDRDGDGDTNMHSGEHDSSDAAKRPGTNRGNAWR